MFQRLILLLLTAVLAVGCATVPGTGRRQLILFSQAEEAQLGFEAWEQTMATAKVVQSGPQRAMVKKIGQRIAAVADQLYPKNTASFQWQFELIDEPQTVNAWALPGGKSAVYTGLLPVTQTELGLAVVMGHEVSHALARHGGERMSQAAAVNGLLNVGQALAGPAEKGSDKALLFDALGVGSQVGMLAFGRNHESEADEIGLMLMARAGYDPREAVRLWERMASLSGDRPPEFLSTHPSEETRISRLKKLMPEALAIYKKHGGS